MQELLLVRVQSIFHNFSELATSGVRIFYMPRARWRQPTNIFPDPSSFGRNYLKLNISHIGIIDKAVV
jgi:hypothetical protein